MVAPHQSLPAFTADDVRYGISWTTPMHRYLTHAPPPAGRGAAPFPRVSIRGLPLVGRPVERPTARWQVIYELHVGTFWPAR